MNHHTVEYTDTYGGEANYAWVRRADITMPELTHYGYDGGTNYAKAARSYEREHAPCKSCRWIDWRTRACVPLW